MYETIKQEQALLVMVIEQKSHWPVQALAEEFRNLVLSTGISVAELVIVKGRIFTPSL